MKILQLKQEQIPHLPFDLARGYGINGTNVKVTDHEDRYLMIPMQIRLMEDGTEVVGIYNIMIAMAAMKGFTHLMLIYANKQRKRGNTRGSSKLERRA